MVGEAEAGGLCKNSSTLNCGAKFPEGGNTCGGKECCCDRLYGTGMQVNTCGYGEGFTNRGCESCWGDAECMKTKNMNIGSNS